MSVKGVKTSPVKSGSENCQHDVAIVGMACVFPKAKDVTSYWENIVNKVDAVTDPPAEWEPELFLDRDIESDNDRIYCAKGGYLGELAQFNPMEHGVMPNSVDGSEPDHFLALKVAREALADAGYLEDGVNRERTEVIIGRGTYVNRGNTTAVQHGMVVDQVLRILKQLHPEHTQEELSIIKKKLKDSLPPFHAETAAGLVPNIISGRIANRLDFMGPNYIVDAACASSLIAVDLGMRDLTAGRCDMAVVGGVHASTSPIIVMIFCQLNAISQRGAIRPFDSRADGTLLGEGVGMVVLKRLHDAQRDGDRTYAVLKGVGTASDGRALGLLAPRREGEELALRRAYEETGISVSTIGLIEAHGTATPAGDGVEMEALNGMFGPREGELPRCALGSVKSMISHLMPASGIAGLIKTTLALYHKVLPPTINCEQPDPKLEFEESVFYLNTETRPWIHGSKDSPRRAGVNAFGFGGINAHAILEEYTGSEELETPSFHQLWSSEVFILSGHTRSELLNEAKLLREYVSSIQRVNLKDLAFTLNVAEFKQSRLAVVAGTPTELEEKLSRAMGRLEDPACQRIRDIDGIYFFQTPLGDEGKVAFVFPGEGSQYIGMLADLCIHFPEVRQFFDLMDRAFAGHSRQYLPSQVIFPPPSPGTKRATQQQEKRLWQMDAGAEAVFTANQALFALLTRLKIKPAAMLGHSTGEHSALLAAGVIQVDSDEELVEHVLEVNSIYERLNSRGEIPPGVLVAVGGCKLSVLEDLVEKSGGKLYIAMDNCPHQVILCGTEQSVAEATEKLKASRAICQVLPFERAYHTPWFKVFSEPLRGYFDGLKTQAGQVDVYSCVTAKRYPRDPDQIRSLAAGQWARSVRFRETVEAMHRDGIHIFVEVGPRGNLIAFINDILRDKEFTAIPADVLHRSGTTQLNHLVGQLTAHGVSLSLRHLYARRSPRRLDLEALSQGAGEEPLSSKGMHLATGLQPLRLPPDFTAAPPQVRHEETQADRRRQQPRQVNDSEKTSVRSISARVMKEHLRTMEEFLETQKQVMGDYLKTDTLSPAPPSGKAPGGHVDRGSGKVHNLPFLQTTTVIASEQQATAICQFKLAEHSLFQQHTLGRGVSVDDPTLLALPVVPLTITMEILAEGAALLQPGKVLIGMRNIRAYRWITLEEPPPAIEISAQAQPGKSGAVDVSIRELVSDNSKPATVLAEGTMIFADDYPKPGPAVDFVLKEEAPSQWTSERLYREGMFHGPCFQGVKSVDTTGRDGTKATLEVLPRHDLFRDQKEPNFLTDPVVLDAAGQVVAFWTREELKEGFDIFPYRLDAMELFGPLLLPGTELQCRVRTELLGDKQIRSDIEIVDSAGNVSCRLEGWEDRRFEIPEKF
ncbi:MAG: beta-ketoacyl synthase N-terminal-like domain-containing protein, partial [Acidobacteriota bacterium]